MMDYNAFINHYDGSNFRSDMEKNFDLTSNFKNIKAHSNKENLQAIKITYSHF